MIHDNAEDVPKAECLLPDEQTGLVTELFSLCRRHLFSCASTRLQINTSKLFKNRKATPTQSSHQPSRKDFCDISHERMLIFEGEFSMVSRSDCQFSFPSFSPPKPQCWPLLRFSNAVLRWQLHWNQLNRDWSTIQCTCQGKHQVQRS